MSAPHRLRAVSTLALTVVVSAATGCAGRYGSSPARPSSSDGGGEPGEVGKGGIEAAALPYQIVDARTGRSVDEPAFWDRVSRARAVCIGEEHRNPHHHWMQLHIVRGVLKRLPKGTRFALSMEMFQRPFQGALDDYAAKKIDDATLRSRSGYAERWGYNYGFYGPTIDATVAAGGALLAANAPKELTKKISRQGIDSLTPEERAQVPELRLDDKAHRAWFDALMDEMGGHAAHGKRPTTESAEPAEQSPPPTEKPHGDREPGAGMPSGDRIYTVQVTWDETMADVSAKWLSANPSGHLVVLAGNGHCHDSAIVNRMKRRGIADTISIRGVIDDGEGSVGNALAKPMNDYVVVLQMPEGVQRAPESPESD